MSLFVGSWAANEALPRPHRDATVRRSPGDTVRSRRALARANGCGTPLVALVEKGAGQERFAATCAGGRPFAPITCDFTGCRIVP